MEAEVANNVELASFHSCSKGFLGECGIRGGFFDLENIDPEVVDMFVKSQSISLCSNTMGQIMTDLMVHPPNLAMESAEAVESYNAEVKSLMDSLKTRATTATEMLNSMTNVQSNEVEGAMYAFPSLKLSQRFCDEAKAQNVAPDYLYCSKVLDNTGVVLVPGSGFLQKEGTHHFRSTILPLPVERFNSVFGELKKFNDKLHNDYA